MTNPATTTERTTAAPAADDVPRRGPASLRFYVCVGILLVSAGGMQALARKLGSYFRKEAVPLKKSLQALEWERLAPEYRQHLIQGRPLGEEELQQIGTRDCLSVRLVDPQRARTDPLRVANVLITYHTGQPDMVPHVPDECYLAGGYDPAGRPRTVTVRVPGVGAKDDRIPVRILQFQAREGEDRPTVLYFFHVNGDYMTTRTEVRLRLANLRERYAYYAKIEVSFTDDADNPRERRHAGPDESVVAFGRLLRKLMPVLLKDHFAWDQVVSEEIAARVEPTD